MNWLCQDDLPELLSIVKTVSTHVERIYIFSGKIMYIAHCLNPSVQMAAAEYTVYEGDGSVDVCVTLSFLPAGGLECELFVFLEIRAGVKAGK